MISTSLAECHWPLIAADLARALALKPCSCGYRVVHGDEGKKMRVTTRCDGCQTLDRWRDFLKVQPEAANAG